MGQKEVIIIFGATGGIGSNLAIDLKSSGKDVILCSRDEKKLKVLSIQMDSDFYICDSIQEDCIKNIFDCVYKKYGRIDGVANCIGSFFIKPLEKTSLKEFYEVLNVNLTSSFLIIKEAVEKMSLHKSGSILLFSSCAAKIGLVHHEAISAAKGAIEALGRSAAASYACKNIRINTISPGLIDTPLSKPITSNEIALKTSIGFHPLGRIGQVNDIIPLANFLLSEKSGFITGENISVDGGLTHIKIKTPNQ